MAETPFFFFFYFSFGLHLLGRFATDCVCVTETKRGRKWKRRKREIVLLQRGEEKKRKEEEKKRDSGLNA
jgi:hypothetical protein